MLANGPAWTNTGVPSSVCSRVGISASFISTVMAPPTPKSSAVIASPFLLDATTALPSLSRRSGRSWARARMAMASDATAMSKPVSRGAFSFSPFPMVIPLSALSLTSTTRRVMMVSGSMSRRANAPFCSAVNESPSISGSMPSLASLFFMTGAKRRLPPAESLGTSRSNRASSFCVDSWNMRVSMAAASRLLAIATAWRSPVRCRLNSSIGMICEYPPPAAPPFIPKVGPMLGCLTHVNTGQPRCLPNA
mmetsp:Transcript_44470/g.110704  ORF Transcript_44470/g.110704 Transcript_44470/m.110704 type:complete len:250 (-) Transcript_44470:235-984(-)